MRIATLCLAVQSGGLYSPSLTPLFSLSTSFSFREDSKDKFRAPPVERVYTSNNSWVCKYYIKSVALFGVYSRSNGDFWGHSTFGSAVLKRSGVSVQDGSFSLRLGTLIRVCLVAERTRKAFRVSREKIMIHASNESVSRSSTKYFPLRKILHRSEYMPMAVWLGVKRWQWKLKVPRLVSWLVNLLRAGRRSQQPAAALTYQSSHGDGTFCWVAQPNLLKTHGWILKVIWRLKKLLERIKRYCSQLNLPRRLAWNWWLQAIICFRLREWQADVSQRGVARCGIRAHTLHKVRDLEEPVHQVTYA